MGPPRLASLALLLLALCRPVSSGVQWSSVNTAISKSENSFLSTEASENAKKEMLKPTASGSLEDLFKYAGNTAIMLILMNVGILHHLPMHLQEAFFNGVQCEFKQPGIDKLLAKALYGQETVPNEARGAEEDFFKKDGMKQKIDCNKQASPPTVGEKCFCADKLTAFYCFGLLITDKMTKEKGQPKTCRVEALAALKTTSPEIFNLYDLENSKTVDFSRAAHSGKVDSVVGNEDAAIGKLLCEATKANVKSAIETLYAADALYWMTEAAIMTILFGQTKRDLKTACEEKTYMDNAYGKCLCEQKTGFSFCIYKVLGDFFVDKGYLKCPDGGAASYDKDKKPSSLPSLTPPASSAAATSDLLLLPAAAAAAMLLQGR